MSEQRLSQTVCYRPKDEPGGSGFAEWRGRGEGLQLPYLLPLPEWPRGPQDAPVSDEDWNKAVSGQ